MNLKIVGAGQLGIRIGVLWKESFPEASVHLKTKHNNIKRNELWQSFGFIPLSQEEENDSNRVTAPFVVFSAPLTNITDYAKEVQIGIEKDWDFNSDGTKEFVFTGSGGVYAENSGGIVDENSETKSVSQRSKALISSEKIVEQFGGTTIRFGGLYTKTRGAHKFWLGNKENNFASSPNGLNNLIHYDDAARCVIKILLKTLNGRYMNWLKTDFKKSSLFLASDGIPISRQNVCQVALKNPFYQEKCMPVFSGDTALVDGKMYSTYHIRTTLDWKPVFTSFEVFMLYRYDEEMDISQFYELNMDI